MAKRRTKREKATAHHHFTISWSGEAEKPTFEPNVKRQFKNHRESQTSKKPHIKNAMGMAKERSIILIKRDITKSLILASLILSVEVMIYLLWR